MADAARVLEANTIDLCPIDVPMLAVASQTWYGIPKEFWGIPQLKKYIYARFGVVYESDRSYHFLLEFGDLSFKYPDKFSTRRNEAQIAVRMEEIYAEVLPLMEKPDWEIFCSDEVRLVLEAITRKAWLKKGRKTVLNMGLWSKSPDVDAYTNILFRDLESSGIKKKYKLPKPAEDNIYRMTEEERERSGIKSLPEDLYEAIKLTEKSALVKETLGSKVFEYFIRNKNMEWDEYKAQVSKYEIDKYLPIL